MLVVNKKYIMSIANVVSVAAGSVTGSMSMVNILQKSVNELVPVITVVSALNTYARQFKLIVPLTHVVREANALKIGAKSVQEVIGLMKVGKINDAIFHIYGVRNVPEPMLRKLNSEMSHLPIYDVTRHHASALQLQNNITDIVDAKNVKMTDIQKSSSLKRMLNYMSSKKFISFSGINVVIGVGAVAAFFAIKKHQKKTTGCLRYSKVNGKFVVCKVAECSCENGKMILDKYAYHCGPNVHIPKGMLQPENCKNVTGIGCVNCPMAKETSNTTDGGDNGDDGDEVFYKCNVPNFFEAAADVLNNSVDSAINTIHNIGSEIGSFMSLIFIIVKFMIIAIPTIFIVFWTYSKYNNAKMRENQ